MEKSKIDINEYCIGWKLPGIGNIQKISLNGCVSLFFESNDKLVQIRSFIEGKTNKLYSFCQFTQNSIKQYGISFPESDDFTIIESALLELSGILTTPKARKPVLIEPTLELNLQGFKIRLWFRNIDKFSGTAELEAFSYSISYNLSQYIKCLAIDSLENMIEEIQGKTNTITENHFIITALQIIKYNSTQENIGLVYYYEW